MSVRYRVLDALRQIQDTPNPPEVPDTGVYAYQIINVTSLPRQRVTTTLHKFVNEGLARHHLDDRGDYKFRVTSAGRAYLERNK